jgi:LmbE family N-acetylglucosaminyl deacetylase
MPLRTVLRLLGAGCLLVFCLTHTTFAAKKYTLLVVLTHGDDNVAIAPLLAKYTSEGHSVYYATFTGVQDPSGVEGSPAREQLLCASRALGVRETFVMRGPGGAERPVVVIAAVAARLTELINQTKPDVIITWGPDGLTGHPRHTMVSEVVTRVVQQQGLLKHKPRKLYYIAYPESLLPDTRLPFGEIAAGNTQGADMAGPFGTVSDTFITTKVDGRRYLKKTREAIACHTTPKGESNKQWQEEWSERLATTLGGTVFLRLVLPAPRGRETDIFKGL